MLPNNLPSPLTRFIGRDREIVTIIQLVSGDFFPSSDFPHSDFSREVNRARLVTLIGVGGSGKTRLAIEVARNLVDSLPPSGQLFTDGIWFIPLASLSTSTFLVQIILDQLNLRESPGMNPTETLAHILGKKNILLLFDNCEHLLEGCIRLFEMLLPACPGVTILATSRAALNLKGEVNYPVPPLKIVNPNERLSLANLVQCESVHLFGDRAQAVLPQFVFTEHNMRAVLQICQFLDGIPLAIELAAVRTKTLTPQEIAERLGNMLQLLRSSSPISEPRHQSLQTAFDWSWALLAMPEQVLFRRLAVFVGGWTLLAAEQVASDEHLEMRIVLDLHERLLDQSLIQRMDDARSERARYFMLQPVWQYALEKLKESGEIEQVCDRHLAYYETLAEQTWYDFLTPDWSAWPEKYAIELNNFRSSLNWSLYEGRIERGLRMTIALFHFWLEAGYLTESIEISKNLLSFPDASVPLPTRAKAFAFLANSLLRLGDHEAAITAATEALTIEKISPDTNTKAYALAALGHAYGLQGNYPQALVYLKQGLALFRESSYLPGLAWTLSRLGTVALQFGDYEQAGPPLTELAERMRESGNLMYLGYALRYCGFTLLQQGDTAGALRKFQDMLALFTKPEDVYGASLAAVAAVAIPLRQAQRAVRLLGCVSSNLEAFHTILLPYDLKLYKRNIDVLRTRLSEMVFNAAWEAGHKLTLAQAFQEALAVGDPHSSTSETPATHPLGLTGREVEVLRLVTLGFSNQEIAEHLVISRRTVHAHLRSIFDKLGVPSRTAAARQANRLNLI